MHDASQAAWSSIEQVQKGSWWEQAFYSSGESLTVIWRQWQNSKFEVFCECAFQPNWKKTRFFSSNRPELLVKWVFTCPPLCWKQATGLPVQPQRGHIKSSEPKYVDFIFLCNLWLKGKVIIHRIVKPAPNIPILIILWLFLGTILCSFGYIVYEVRELEVSLLLRSFPFRLL